MSSWAYRECSVCKGSVHIGFLCDCGNDVHYVISRYKEARKEAKTRYVQAQKELRIAQREFAKANVKLATIEARQQERKDRRAREIAFGKREAV